MRTWRSSFFSIFTLGALSFLVSCATSTQLSSIQAAPSRSHRSPSRELASVPAALSSAAKAQSQSAQEAPHQVGAQLGQKELNLTPSLGDLSREWGLHPYEIRKQSAALEQFVRYGRYPKAHCVSGKPKTGKDKKLCEQVSLIVASYSKNKSLPKRAPSMPSGFAKTGKQFKLHAQNLGWAQNKHFDDLIDSITPMSTQQILKWTPQILKHRSCPRNFSAAAIRKIENFLPDNEAKVAIEKLYAHASSCLKPRDPAYAITHFRQALLRLLWGDHSRARVSASLAPLGATGEELPRTLFWAGFLQTDPSLRNQYWTKLISDHPLSFHAINAHRHMSQDPLADVISRPIVPPSRHGNSRQLTLSLRWFEALMLSGKETAASRLAFWISSNNKDDLSLGNIIYITHLKADQNTHQASFGFVWNQIENNPSNMNEQTLKLMFPLPYWEVFKQNSGGNDPFLLVSVARQESAFNPRATSPANARGLLQLLPSTAHAMAGKHVNLYAPEINTQLGSKFLKRMVDKFDSVEMALAAYNAGPMRIPTWRKRFPTRSSLLFIDLIPYKETRNYVANILRNNYWYNRLYDDAPFRNSQIKQVSPQSTLVTSLLKATHNKPSPSMSVAQATPDIEPSAR